MVRVKCKDMVDATCTKIQLLDTELQIYKFLPTQQLYIAQFGVGLAVGKSGHSVRNFMFRTPEGFDLRQQGFTPRIIALPKQFIAIPLRMAAAFWMHEAKNGNQKALEICLGGLIQSLILHMPLSPYTPLNTRLKVLPETESVEFFAS